MHHLPHPFIPYQRLNKRLEKQTRTSFTILIFILMIVRQRLISRLLRVSSNSREWGWDSIGAIWFAHLVFIACRTPVLTHPISLTDKTLSRYEWRDRIAISHYCTVLLYCTILSGGFLYTDGLGELLFSEC